MQIFQETKSDWSKVNDIIKNAFLNEVFSDQTEHLLVPKLRKSASFIPELSLVAKINNEPVGHILFTKITVVNPGQKFNGLSLAPVSVLPKYQNQGIGSTLISQGHLIARQLGYQFIILLGHEKYYLKFGYNILQENISLPFPAPRQNCFSKELIEGSLNNVKGVVKYDDAFLSF